MQVEGPQIRTINERKYNYQQKRLLLESLSDTAGEYGPDYRMRSQHKTKTATSEGQNSQRIPLHAPHRYDQDARYKLLQRKEEVLEGEAVYCHKVHKVRTVLEICTSHMARKSGILCTAHNCKALTEEEGVKGGMGLNCSNKGSGRREQPRR